MKRKFRVTCVGYDLCGHQPAFGCLKKPMHTTYKAAALYAQLSAIEDASVLVKSIHQIGEDKPYSIHIKINENGHGEDVRVYYTDELNNEFTYSEYYIEEITKCDNTNTHFLYRGFRIELNLSEKQYYIYSVDGSLINQAINMRACCDIIDTIFVEMLSTY